MPAGKPKVVVVGSVRVDIAIRCIEFPSAGSTTAGSRFSCTPAGDSANQAIQAALCGCEVYMVGKVGKDIFSQQIKNNLANFGINCDFLFEAEAKNTGVTVSFVNNSGTECGVCSDGANKSLVLSDIENADFEKLLSSADACLINGSLDSDFICGVIRSAKLNRTKVILDPAVNPENLSNLKHQLPLDYYTADIFVPNFAEAAEISTSASNHNIHAAKLIGSDLIARGVGCAVIKLGRRGALVAERSGTTHIPAFEVQCIDHTSCGDAFDGAFAASCAVGDSMANAVKFASAAGALACTKFGSQESLPKKTEILELLQRLS